MPLGESRPHPIETTICMAENFSFDTFSVHFTLAANFSSLPLPTILYAIYVFDPLLPIEGLSVACQSWCSKELP